MCAPVLIPLAAAAIGLGGSIYAADQQRSAANQARDDANAAAEKQASIQSAKAPKTATATTDAMQAATGTSSGSTLLTGPNGIDQNQLTLGANQLGGSTLLGQ